ncbi:acyl-CoA dehydrogenase [Streptomyces drozdowiczii]|uniref:Acyl-CoA dehydrogenase n=1 Tax=Streptomyces drozdowiczii TaxID=202862 RepID=A0ABY6Q0U6_9ACTN|nr:acyl-CoA dehydrogenase [Streptomyces drozdowiczii]MCX0241717.1 acyl-CoA dehydrogenase [Streptomyces drozdowiczii]UZK58062.1 acyl-CoA dehydrogenase [Streptomyces drozdowiczii]
MTATAPVAHPLQENVSKVLPTLREHARWTDDNRRIHEATLDALVGTGALRMRVPARYSGEETDFATLQSVIGEIARGDGAAAWNTAVWSMCAWLAGLFPDQVQDEVFADPDVRVCGVLSPSAQARPDGSDMIIDGRWAFVSGALHSQWQVVLAMAPAPGGDGVWPVMALVPTAELQLEDDWFTSGLRGTGSITTIADNVRVPMERVLPLPLVLQGQYATELNQASPVWNAPMMATGSACFAGAAVGLARAAVETFHDRLPGRKITYTAYESRREAPVTHLHVAEAAYLADEAEFHARRIAGDLDRKGLAREPWTLPERIAARAALGRTFRQAAGAVEALATASGGSGLYSTDPIQRIRRDVQALNLHALMHPDTNAELYGRALCGLDPNTSYL